MLYFLMHRVPKMLLTASVFFLLELSCIQCFWSYMFLNGMDYTTQVHIGVKMVGIGRYFSIAHVLHMPLWRP